MTHEAGEVAKTFVDSLKDQPLSLALVVMNLALLGMLYYQGSAHAKEHADELTLMYQNRRETAVLLARCKWPDDLPLPKDFQ